MVEDTRKRQEKLIGAAPAIKQCLNSMCPLAALIREELKRQAEILQAFIDDPMSVDINALQLARGALLQVKNMHDTPLILKAEIEDLANKKREMGALRKKNIQKHKEIYT